MSKLDLMATRAVNPGISGLTLGQALRAARAVRHAGHGGHGDRAYATVRPRGLFGLARSRPPLFVLPWTAAQEGRLVWPDASVTLVSRALAAAKDGRDGPRVRFGPILTLNTRVSSRALHEYLRAAEPDAIGGEMEGSGIYAAGATGKVDWIVIKGISDWGGHGGADRDVAAAAAAGFVVHVIEAGGLNRPPAR